MKISVQITVTSERVDGSKITLDRTVVTHHGDNPSFERVETRAAVKAAQEMFVVANALSGTRPL